MFSKGTNCLAQSLAVRLGPGGRRGGKMIRRAILSQALASDSSSWSHQAGGGSVVAMAEEWDPLSALKIGSLPVGLGCQDFACRRVARVVLSTPLN